MKKSFSLKGISFLMVFVLLMSLFLALGHADTVETQGIKLCLNGVEVETGNVSPFIENGYTMVPLRHFCEALGATVKWDNRTRTVSVKVGDVNIKLTIAKKEAVVNGNNKTLPVAPKIISGRTLVPLRFIAEALGASVNWVAPSNEVIVLWSGRTRGSDESLPPLRLGGVGKFTLMNPFINPWHADLNFFVGTHTPLVIYKPDLHIAPGLAEKWEISPDGKTVTFTIRDDAKWSDGKPLTVEDVKFSCEYWKDVLWKKYGVYGTTGGFLNSYLDRVEIQDKKTVKIIFKEPVAVRFLNASAPALTIIPKHVWNKVEEPLKYDGPDAMVGCGPFVFERFDPETQTVFLKANENYFFGKPSIPKIQWRYFPTTDALVMAMQKGEIDAQTYHTNSLSGIYVDALKEAGLLVEEVPGLAVYPILYFGFRQYPVNLREFREAISLAINYPLLVKMLCGAYGEVPGKGLTPPGAPGYKPGLTKHTYNPEEARRILDAAGFVDRDGDGFRETPDGKKLRIPVTAPAEVTERVRAAEVITLNLREIGLDAYMEVLENTAYRAKAYQTKDYYLRIGGTSAHLVAAYSPGGYVDFVDAPGNYGTCKDPELLEIVNNIEHAKTIEQRNEAVERLQEYIARELPAIPLVWRTEVVPHSNKWTGWVAMNGFNVCNFWTWYNLRPAVRK